MGLPPTVPQKADFTLKPSSHRGRHSRFAYWRNRLSSRYLVLYVWKSVNLGISVLRRQCQLSNQISPETLQSEDE